MFRLMIVFGLMATLAPAVFSQENADGVEPSGRVVDFAVLRTEVIAIDASYSDGAREAALTLISEFEVQVQSMSDAEFGLAVAQVSALSDNGHSQILAPMMAAGMAILPVRFLLADNQLYVVATAPDLDALRNREVATICGQNLTELRALWNRYATGRQGYQDQSLYYFIETPALLEAAGVCTPGYVELEFVDGERVALEARSDVFPPAEGIWQFLPNARALSLVQQASISDSPLYLQDPEAVFRLVELSEQDAVYIQFRSNIDFSGQIDLREVADAAIGTLREIGPSVVIVDQRFNLGGDLNTTRDLMEAIPEIVGDSGSVFVITSGRTFSAGISSVGYLKQAGSDRVTIVGEPVGDNLEFWAEGDPVRLPSSGLMVMRANERHNYMTGCQEDDCHRSIRIFPIRVESLEPDLAPAFTYADILEGRDPWLEAIYAVLDEE